MQVGFLLLCEYASQLATGAPVLAGVFRVIGSHEFPARLDPFYVAIEIECDPFEGDRIHEMTLQMVDADGQVYYRNELSLEVHRRPDMLPSNVYSWFRVCVEREIPSPGAFRFDLLYNGDVIGQTRFEIRGPDV